MENTMDFAAAYAKHEVKPSQNPGMGFHWCMGATYRAMLKDPTLSLSSDDSAALSLSTNLHLAAELDPCRNHGFTNGYKGIREMPRDKSGVEFWSMKGGRLVRDAVQA